MTKRAFDRIGAGLADAKASRDEPARGDFVGDASAAGILNLVAEAGLAGVAEPELLRAFCLALNKARLPVARAMVMIDTLHPVHEGHVFRWRSDQAEAPPGKEYGRVSEGGDAAEKWKASPFHHLLETGGSVLRRRIGPEDALDFPVLDDLRLEGQTDYLALIHRFAADGVIGEMDGVYSSWATDAPGGFTEGQLEALRKLVPSLALAIKCAALARIAETLVETYLGRDAGRRVLSGRIARGVAERIGAVLWYSDLRGFTRITETCQPDEIIPFLNDYADAIIASVHEAGGDVLKLIGDGTLAIFKADDPATACRSALQAEALMRARLAALNEARAARALPLTQAYLGLHIGEVFYGNVGSQDRLDFTVVGPAVNEASRIAALCRSIEKDVLISSAFAEAAQEEERARLVSVGRYALKGVERAQELFTLE
jgi:adenylate cyclase